MEFRIPEVQELAGAQFAVSHALSLIALRGRVGHATFTMAFSV